MPRPFLLVLFFVCVITRGQVLLLYHLYSLLWFRSCLYGPRFVLKRRLSFIEVHMLCNFLYILFFDHFMVNQIQPILVQERAEMEGLTDANKVLDKSPKPETSAA
ncbi:unnamed protein product [Cuscuta europaea]|uniref:Uncharacterized protein n=1 Tax=Cuscuta europaea TaxID=41803 RepID=A0A9P1E635_CUSEU|nr:unnamed protein product [Cuscuta europaea]